MVSQFAQDVKDIKEDGRVMAKDVTAIRLLLAEKYVKKVEVKALRQIGAEMFEDAGESVSTSFTCEPPCTVPDIGEAP